MAPSAPPPQVPIPAPTEHPTPTVEPTSLSTATASGVAPPPAPKKLPKGMLVLGACLLIVGLLGGYGIGHYLMVPTAKTAETPAISSQPQAKKLEIPREATVIAECAVGRGKQYVLPNDIPTGPVYNVWNNEVIGVEFMVGRDELLSQNKNFINLPLGGASYDHINIGLLSQGHAGFTQPHYHVDLFTVSNDEAQKITCK